MVLATALELGHIVLNYSFNSRDEVEGRGKRGNILCFGGSAGYEVLPVSHSDLCIPQPEKNVTEVHLLQVLTSLAHDLVQDNRILECLVGCSPLVGELSTVISSVEGKVHDWRKLSKQKAGTSSEHFQCMVEEGLVKMSVHLAQGLPPHHRHLFHDQILHI